MACSKRRSLLVRVTRTVQKLPLGWLRCVERLFLKRQSGRKRLPMIILLALPRSGSTLTYQVLVHTFQPVYLSNLANVLFQLPLFGGWLSVAWCRGYQSDFKSDHGLVAGLCGPAEGLQFWRYWLGAQLDDRAAPNLSARKQRQRLNYLRAVYRTLGRQESPVVTGFLGHTLMPDHVQQSFPEAIVVRLWREPISNALSILKCRRESEGLWFSLFPRECTEYLGENEHEQVAAQVYWLNRRLDEACQGAHVFWLNYDALCENPREEMSRLAKFCKSHGLQLLDRNPLPDSFQYRRANPAVDPDAAKLSQAIAVLEQTHGKLSRMEQPDGGQRDAA